MRIGVWLRRILKDVYTSLAEVVVENKRVIVIYRYLERNIY